MLIHSRIFNKIFSKNNISYFCYNQFSLQFKEIQKSSKNIYNIGYGKKLKIKCISETGWKDSQLLIQQFMQEKSGFMSQYNIKLNEDNGLGSCSLISYTDSNDITHNFLIDSGWNHPYIKQRFQEEKIDIMLKNKEIEFIYITHEHFDHFYGLGVVLQLYPEIPIIIPETFSKQAIEMLQAKSTENTKPYITVPHKGPLFFSKINQVYQIYEGCATSLFQTQEYIGTKGEQSLFFNIKGKGYVTATGCCHQGIISLLDFLKNNFEAADKQIYGLYGGLHIAPMDKIDKQGIETVDQLGKFDLKKIACNHCTGLEAVQQMKKKGYPIISGSGNKGSKTDQYLGNGDLIEF